MSMMPVANFDLASAPYANRSVIRYRTPADTKLIGNLGGLGPNGEASIGNDLSNKLLTIFGSDKGSELYDSLKNSKVNFMGGAGDDLYHMGSLENLYSGSVTGNTYALNMGDGKNKIVLAGKSHSGTVGFGKDNDVVEYGIRPQKYVANPATDEFEANKQFNRNNKLTFDGGEGQDIFRLDANTPLSMIKSFEQSATDPNTWVYKDENDSVLTFKNFEGVSYGGALYSVKSFADKVAAEKVAKPPVEVPVDVKVA